LAVDRLRALTQWGAVVIFVHHSRKDNETIERGSGALRAAVDQSWSVKENADGTVTVDTGKSRNTGRDATATFRIVADLVGKTPAGHDVTATYIEECDAPTWKPERPGGKTGEALDWLEESDKMKKENWREICLERWMNAGSTKSAAERTFSRAVNALEDSNFVENLFGIYRAR